MVRDWLGGATLVVALAVAGCGSDDGEMLSSAEGSEASSESESGSQSGSQGGSTTASDSASGSVSAGTESGSDSAGSDSASTTEGSSGGEDSELIEVRVGDFQVPQSETYYACFEYTFQLDALGHIIRFNPVVDQAAYVHHFVVTLIDGPTGQDDGYTCFDLAGDMVWAWAPGQGEFELPTDVGYLVGDAPGGEVTVRLQVHYNNPLGVTGMLDNSGFDMWVTNDLRPNSAGTLVFGDTFGISIPPGQEAYEYVMTCPSSTTANRFEHEIHVFGSSMHAHEIGSVLYTEVWRDGEFAYELNRDDPYLFDSQHIKFVDEIMMPGDEIRNHCFYDSTERGGVTLGGPGTENEMCWDTIMYYPKFSNGFDVCGAT